jgi:hypothetical protein
METKYILKNNGINVASEKKWLTRKGYSKIVVKVFGELAKPLDNISDSAIASRLRVSKRTYQEAKRELVMCGLLEVHRLNASTIVYLVGTKAIEENAKVNQRREDDRMIRLTLESIGMQKYVYEDVTEEVHVSYDFDTTKVELPSPINLTSKDIM